MQRVKSSRNAAIDKFGVGKNGFRKGDPQLGVAATTPGFEWFDAIQEELAAVVENAGLVLDENHFNQVYSAILKICEKNATASIKAHKEEEIPHKEYALKSALDHLVQVMDTNIIPGEKLLDVIVLTKPHYRCFVWDGTKYVRAPWHQPAMMQYSYNNPSNINGFIRVDGLSQYAANNYPDLSMQLGVAAGSNFSLIDVRGEFIRVLDNGRGVDVGRLPLSYQAGTATTTDNPPDAYITSIWNNASGTHDQNRQNMGMDKPSGLDGDKVWAAVGGRSSGGASFKDCELNTPSNWPTCGMTRPRNIAFPLWVSI